MVTRIRKASAQLVEHNNEKSYVLYLRLAHPFEHVRKINDVNTLVKDCELTITWKKFLHDCADLLPESVQNMSAEDTCEILGNAEIEYDARNYKAGEEYTREDGSADKYTAMGTDVKVRNLVLSQLTINRFENDKKAKKEVANKISEILDGYISRNLDPTHLTFNL